MRTVISTDAVHPRDRFDYWHEMLCRKIVQHDCKPEIRQSFRAELKSTSVGDVDLIHYQSTPMLNDVAARHVARANPDWLLVRRQMAGVFVVEQDGREAVLEAGDMTVLDPRRPMRGKYSRGAAQLVLKIPRRKLKARVGNTTLMIARAIKPSPAEHGLISAFLSMLQAHVEGLNSATAAIVENQALDLIAVALSTATDGQSPRLSSARALVFLRLRAAIEARLPDPALDAEAVAAAAGISVRYANAVLAADDLSIMRLVLARRLERCRLALEAPSQAHRTVSEIAYGWGFSDMTHFGRKFRAAYRMLPSEYRRRAKSG